LECGVVKVLIRKREFCRGCFKIYTENDVSLILYLPVMMSPNTQFLKKMMSPIHIVERRRRRKKKKKEERKREKRKENLNENSLQYT